MEKNDMETVRVEVNMLNTVLDSSSNFDLFDENMPRRRTRSSILKLPRPALQDVDLCTEDEDKRKSGKRRVSFAEKFQVMEMHTGNIYDISGQKSDNSNENCQDVSSIHELPSDVPASPPLESVQMSVSERFEVELSSSNAHSLEPAEDVMSISSVTQKVIIIQKQSRKHKLDDVPKTDEKKQAFQSDFSSHVADENLNMSCSTSRPAGGIDMEMTMVQNNDNMNDSNVEIDVMASADVPRSSRWFNEQPDKNLQHRSSQAQASSHTNVEDSGPAHSHIGNFLTMDPEAEVDIFHPGFLKISFTDEKGKTDSFVDPNTSQHQNKVIEENKISHLDDLDNSTKDTSKHLQEVLPRKNTQNRGIDVLQLDFLKCTQIDSTEEADIDIFHPSSLKCSHSLCSGSKMADLYFGKINSCVGSATDERTQHFTSENIELTCGFGSSLVLGSNIDAENELSCNAVDVIEFSDRKSHSETDFEEMSNEDTDVLLKSVGRFVNKIQSSVDNTPNQSFFISKNNSKRTFDKISHENFDDTKAGSSDLPSSNKVAACVEFAQVSQTLEKSLMALEEHVPKKTKLEDSVSVKSGTMSDQICDRAIEANASTIMTYRAASHGNSCKKVSLNKNKASTLARPAVLYALQKAKKLFAKGCKMDNLNFTKCIANFPELFFTIRKSPKPLTNFSNLEIKMDDSMRNSLKKSKLYDVFKAASPLNRSICYNTKALSTSIAEATNDRFHIRDRSDEICKLKDHNDTKDRAESIINYEAVSRLENETCSDLLQSFSMLDNSLPPNESFVNQEKFETKLRLVKEIQLKGVEERRLILEEAIKLSVDDETKQKNYFEIKLMPDKDKKQRSAEELEEKSVAEITKETEQETTDSTKEDTTDSNNQEATDSTKQQTTEKKLQEIIEETTDTAKKGTIEEKLHEITEETNQVTTDETKQETTEETMQITTVESKQETTEESKQETTEESKQETKESKETTKESKQKTTEESKQETTEESKQETTEESKQETTEESKQETTEESKQETTEKSKQETAEESNQETAEVSNQETTEVSNQETTEVSNQETTEVSNQETANKANLTVQEETKTGFTEDTNLKVVSTRPAFKGEECCRVLELPLMNKNKKLSEKQNSPILSKENTSSFSTEKCNTVQHVTNPVILSNETYDNPTEHSEEYKTHNNNELSTKLLSISNSLEETLEPRNNLNAKDTTASSHSLPSNPEQDINGEPKTLRDVNSSKNNKGKCTMFTSVSDEVKTQSNPNLTCGETSNSHHKKILRSHSNKKSVSLQTSPNFVSSDAEIAKTKKKTLRMRDVSVQNSPNFFIPLSTRKNKNDTKRTSSILGDTAENSPSFIPLSIRKTRNSARKAISTPYSLKGHQHKTINNESPSKLYSLSVPQGKSNDNATPRTRQPLRLNQDKIIDEKTPSSLFPSKVTQDKKDNPRIRPGSLQKVTTEKISATPNSGRIYHTRSFQKSYLTPETPLAASKTSQNTSSKRKTVSPKTCIFPPNNIQQEEIPAETHCNVNTLCAQSSRSPRAEKCSEVKRLVFLEDVSTQTSVDYPSVKSCEVQAQSSHVTNKDDVYLTTACDAGKVSVDDETHNLPVEVTDHSLKTVNRETCPVTSGDSQCVQNNQNVLKELACKNPRKVSSSTVGELSHSKSAHSVIMEKLLNSKRNTNAEVHKGTVKLPTGDCVSSEKTGLVNQTILDSAHTVTKSYDFNEHSKVENVENSRSTRQAALHNSSAVGNTSKAHSSVSSTAAVMSEVSIEIHSLALPLPVDEGDELSSISDPDLLELKNILLNSESRKFSRNSRVLDKIMNISKRSGSYWQLKAWNKSSISFHLLRRRLFLEIPFSRKKRDCTPMKFQCTREGFAYMALVRNFLHHHLQDQAYMSGKLSLLKVLSKMIDFSPVFEKANMLMIDLQHIDLSNEWTFTEDFPLTVEILNERQNATYYLTLPVNPLTYMSQAITPSLMHKYKDAMSVEATLSALSKVQPGKNYLWNLVKAAETV